MTALKPIENRRVRAVASERYPFNEICAHPECSEQTADPHHIFPRSAIAGDSWFVEVYMDFGPRDAQPEPGLEVIEGWPTEIEYLSGGYTRIKTILPHVAGLCRAHHDDVEEHRAWIKLEDGEFVWYARERTEDENGQGFDKVGALNPQPGSKTGKPKRRKFKGEKRRTRATISIKVPKDDQEDGGEVWDDLFGDGQDDRPYGRVRERFDALELDGGRPPYNLIVDMANDWLNG